MSLKTNAKKLINESKLQKSKSIDLRFIDEQFDKIPEELFQLTELEELKLGHNFTFKKLPEEILNLKKLKTLEITGNLDEFPFIILNIKTLTKFTLNDSSLKVIPKDIENWSTLRYFNLGNCTNIEEVQGLPPNLRYLYLNGNFKKAIPRAVFGLKHLGKLVITNFDITYLPKEIFELKTLYALFVSATSISTLPKEILKLTNITDLWLSRNNFKRFPLQISKMSGLEELNLSGNSISTLPKSFGNLKNLKYLNLGSNNFKVISPSIFTLKKLVELRLGNYNLDDNTNKNKIKIISAEILQLENLKKIDLFDLNIENIPQEIKKEGLEAIKNYFNSKIEADEEDFLYEAKMVIVGRGDVGKSVLTKKLTIPEYTLSQSESTKGINILKNPWQLKVKGLKGTSDFRFNIWDFGGQEKYDATHQLFITNRSIYLFLTEARAESNYQDVFYWLNTISLLSYNSPVIIVLSKYDERKKILPESIYRDQFSNIIDFVDVSCADGYEISIENLKSSIFKAIKLLPQTKLTLSNHWVNVREKLESLSKERDFIEYSEYLVICQENKLDKSRADFLSEYLNDLGVIIHHRHDLLLKKTVFINTDWCVDGMYKVLDDDLVFKNKGKFTNEDLEVIWKDVRFSDKQAELIRLMQDYSLCFEVSDKSGYIAPDLLLPDKPETITWDNKGDLQFEYQYTFMPTGMISRFIVKAHNFIKDDLYWKYGVVLKYDKTEAIIEEDYINSKIKISVKGENKKGLLSAINMFVGEVHKDFDKDGRLKFEQMVPCNCTTCASSSHPHFYKYNVLRKFEQKPILEIPCERSSETVNVKSLINDIQIQSLVNQIETSEDLKQFILLLINNSLEKDIKLKQGNINFWRNKECSIPKDEVEIQPYICNTLDSLCRVKGINLSREVKEGNGNVDILFSYTNKLNEILKVCVEIKKAHHQDVESAIKNQLPVYLRSADTTSGIYLVIWYKGAQFIEPRKYESEDELSSLIEKNNPDRRNITVKILNCSKQISPSKIK